MQDKPRYGQLTVCWAEDEDEAQRRSRTSGGRTRPGATLGQELPLPSHFEQACEIVTPDDVAETSSAGRTRTAPQAIAEFEDAGFDHVYVHQVGPDQEPFFRFHQREILPPLQPAPERQEPARPDS